jgi:hypothetical protein
MWGEGEYKLLLLLGAPEEKAPARRRRGLPLVHRMPLLRAKEYRRPRIVSGRWFQCRLHAMVGVTGTASSVGKVKSPTRPSMM